MWSGLIMVYIITILSLWLSVILVIIFSIMLGATIEKVSYRPLRSAPHMSILISAIGVSHLQ